MRIIRRVAVLGAGTMGSRIAAQFANAGIPSLLLDLPANEADKSATARSGIDTAAKSRPGAFFTAEKQRLIQPGNFEDHLPELAGCDWIIEAVTENLEIKRNLWRKVDAVRKPEAILSTNTSGIPLSRITEGFSPAFCRNFLGTHFFNPPRYLHLVEVIPGAVTDPEVIGFVSQFCDRRLGKGVVDCKDTPNFIANRIGSFYGATTYKIMVEDGYTIEEVDALTGPLIGVPKSASFRLLDIVGIDIWAHVAQNLYEAVPNDPWRDRFLVPGFVSQMMARNWLGDKTGGGFYKRVGPQKEIWALDWKTFEYHPAAKPRFPSVDALKPIDDLPLRLRTLLFPSTGATPDRASGFVWKLLGDVFLYAAELVPEIADRVVEIDRAMRWGYGHAFGPFELWDALGLELTARRLAQEGHHLPESIARLLDSGARSFYRPADNGGNPKTEYFDLLTTRYKPIEPRPGIFHLPSIKRARGVIKKNPGASLIDLDNGVLCLEFHSKMNTLGDDAVAMVHAGVDTCARSFDAMVIANQGENFSAGANLMLILLAAQDEDWDGLNMSIHRFQQASMAIKYAPKPVVAAPFARVLGGGAEWVLHSARAQASAELYMGLVETAVGLIPAGGGCKEMLLRLRDLRRIFELIGYAKVSTSAEDARQLGLLQEADGLSMNPERLIGDAKTLALAIAPGYTPGVPQTNIPVAGDPGYSIMKLGAWSLHQGGFISDHDLLIGEKVAYILSGGRGQKREVSEQQLLDLEREAFLSLCGHPKTQARIQHMLQTGKPLRN